MKRLDLLQVEENIMQNEDPKEKPLIPCIPERSPLLYGDDSKAYELWVISIILTFAALALGLAFALALTWSRG